MRSLVRTIHKVASGGGKNSVRMELRPLLSGFTLNVIMRMVAGKRYYGEENAEAKESKELISETFELGGFTYVGDFLPVVKLFDFDGYVKRAKKLGSKLDKFLQELLHEHRGKTEFKNTMITHLLTLQESQPEYYTDETIKGLVLVRVISLKYLFDFNSCYWNHTFFFFPGDVICRFGNNFSDIRVGYV